MAKTTITTHKLKGAINQQAVMLIEGDTDCLMHVTAHGSETPTEEVVINVQLPSGNKWEGTIYELDQILSRN